MFCLPVPKDTYVTKPSWVIRIIIALDGLLLLPVLFGSKTNLYFHYALAPDRMTMLTLITSMFLHGGIWHYVGNMWFFWIFGKKIETFLGPIWFLLAYLLCGLAGSLAYCLQNPDSSVPLVGASGAISGIAGMYFVLFPNDRFDLHLYLGYFRIKTITTVTRSAVGAWIAEQFLLSLITMVATFSSTAFSVHVAGFLAGALAGLLYKRIVPAETRPAIEIAVVGEDADYDEVPSGLTTLNLSSRTDEIEK